MKRTPYQTPSIFIMSSDSTYSEKITSYLVANGCAVNRIPNFEEFDGVFESSESCIMLIDSAIGSTVLTHVLNFIRDMRHIYTIVLDGSGDVTDRIVTLELGADDNVDRSINLRELLARIRAVLRRGSFGCSKDITVWRETQQPVSGWKFVRERRELIRPDGSLCRLTSAEFETLRLLHEAMGKTVSRAVLCERVFGRPYQPTDRAIDTVIKKLREKLEPGTESRSIKTVRPIGYVFTGFPAETVGEGSLLEEVT